MLSFDLRSAIFTYAPQHYCSITYDPAVDAYISSFSRTATFAPSFTRAQTVNAHTPNYTGNGTNGVASAQTPNGHTLPTPASSGMQGLTPMTPVVPGADGVNGTHYPQGLTPAATTPGTFNAASPGDAGPANPHEMMAGLLSWRLNELVKQRRDVAARFIKVRGSSLRLHIIFVYIPAWDNPADRCRFYALHCPCFRRSRICSLKLKLPCKPLLARPHVSPNRPLCVYSLLSTKGLDLYSSS